MKSTKRIWFVLLFSALFAGFVSCSKDDDNTDGNKPIDDDYAGFIAGYYVGSFSVMGMPLPDVVTITITKNGDSQTSAILGLNQTIEVPVLGALPLAIECTSSVGFSSKEDRYVINGETTTRLPTVGGEVVEVPVSVTGTIDKSRNATINITVPVSGTPTTVVFTGAEEVYGIAMD